VSRPAFDPWAVLARLRGDAEPFSRVSGISGKPHPPPAADHDAAEQAALAAHYAAPPDAAYQPDAPDLLRDGLLRGFHAHRRADRLD
jgi:hypothetical protein